MNKDAKLYCQWADRGLALHNSGGALLCCRSQTYLQDPQGQQIYWHSHKFEDAWNSPTRREIQDALTRGERHPNCVYCWQEEAAGKESHRQLAIKEQHATIEDDEPYALLMDLKLGNICNLSCRTCNPWVSSKWYADWWETIDRHKTNNNIPVFNGYKDYLNSCYKNGRLSYDIDNRQLWDQLAEWLPRAQYIDIYGAEPMMIDPLFDALQVSVDRGTAANQHIHFNTNGTLWDDRKIQTLTHFKKTFIDVSIDGLYDQFDYLRNGASWDTVIENLERYRPLFYEHRTRHRLSVNCTISVLNIFYLPEVWDYFQERGLFVAWNIAQFPEHISTKSLPQATKSVIADKLLNHQSKKFPEMYTALIQPVVAYMMEQLPEADADRRWTDFVRITTQLDQRRRQDFATTFSELWKLVEPYWQLPSLGSNTQTI